MFLIRILLEIKSEQHKIRCLDLKMIGIGFLCLKNIVSWDSYSEIYSI